MRPLVVYDLEEQTANFNIDNIARTHAYWQFYVNHPEIKWSFLASTVSRNAGWNMTDLTLPVYKTLLSEQDRKALFLTYESINWFIFRDAYPQLLVYEQSKLQGRPLFFLLKYFGVSSFMEQEWYHFYQTKDSERLLTAQIINEQQLIQQPIIKNNPYQRKVFKQLPYYIQSILHLNSILIPTMQGKVYGLNVPPFQNVTNRIRFGKQVANILFYPYLYPLFYDFCNQVDIIGSRKAYEQFTLSNVETVSEPLRECYTRIDHSITYNMSDWVKDTRIKRKWWKEEKRVDTKPFYKQFVHKRQLLAQVANISEPQKKHLVN
ncbi:DUF2515 family protein [Alkalibacillus almallahensis]|uniref:DUF2515 family protein n=1 Tax=Alkalibacillus almallahensis TaxID=1379154 RepID=UPI001424A661|nr:DUF2515 family protein [Alkalibacillus almallahensis]NIK11032.1 hypothetical protein [Alkalibacillus almallahensis]